MFELLDVKRELAQPTLINILDMFYGRSSIVMKGEDDKWYVIQDGNGADIVWEELVDDVEKMIVDMNMEDISKIVIIKGAKEVWCDNECG